MFVNLLFSKFNVYKHHLRLCSPSMIKLKIFQAT